MFKRLPRIIWGDAESDGTWAFDVWKKAIKRANTMTGGSFVFVLDRADGGRTMQVHRDQRIYAVLSGSANPYTAQEVFPTPSGGWMVDPTSPTLTDVYEDDGDTLLNGMIVKLRRDIGEWRFRYVRYGGSGGSGIVLPGCTCTNMPASITQTVTSASGILPASTFYNATLVYGPLPAWMLTIGWGGSNYLSTTTYTDAGGEQFYYFMHCLIGSASYVLSRVYQSSVFAGGGPFFGGNLGQWFPVPPNVCAPFFFPNFTFNTTHGAGDKVVLTP